MEKKTRSLLAELSSMADERDVKHVIESRAHNIISSAVNLIELINKCYDSDKAQVLERKLLNAIKAKDQTKFSNSLKKSSKS
jgi:response regulator RpfG family c-di-GMP phosphodiesterase